MIKIKDIKYINDEIVNVKYKITHLKYEFQIYSLEQELENLKRKRENLIDLQEISYEMYAKEHVNICDL